MDKYKVFNIKEKNPLYSLDEVLLCSNRNVLIKNDKWQNVKNGNINYIFTRNTGVKNVFGYIYEYDLLQVKLLKDNEIEILTGIVAFKKGVFYLKNIHKNGERIKAKIALSVINDSEEYLEIFKLGSILETENCFDYIRDRFFFKINGKDNLYAIDSHQNVYSIDDEDVKFIENDFYLSTDVYDKNGELIYENNKVLINIDGEEKEGVISGVMNGHYMVGLKNNKRYYLNNEFNLNKYLSIEIKA